MKDHAYTIRNFSGTPAYMVDNMENDNRISCEGKVGDAAYWTFEPTTNTHCYHIRNVQTGRYIQGYEKTSGTIICMGSEGVEYRVAAQASEGGRYGFACTSVKPNDFSSGTIGLNLRAESNQADCLVQTYAATAGTNHRSFWTLDAVADDIITGLSTPLLSPMDNLEGVYDLLGRRIKDFLPGINIVRMSDGSAKKIIKR